MEATYDFVQAFDGVIAEANVKRTTPTSTVPNSLRLYKEEKDGVIAGASGEGDDAIPLPVIATGNAMTVYLSTDGSEEKGGFAATYHACATADCRCAAGTFSGDGTSKGNCTGTPCAPGRYGPAAQTSAEAATCEGIPCSPGRYGPVGQTSAEAAACDACAAGTFQDQAAQAACKGCTAGKFQDKAAQATCDACAAGKFQDQAAQSACAGTPCALGRFGPVGQASAEAAACDACAAGTFQDQAAQAACKGCTAGKFQDKAAQAACKGCAAGTFQDQAAQTAASACKGCVVGTFQDRAAQAVCKGCAAGTFQDQAAQTADSACKGCAAGKFQDQAAQTADSACKGCAAGKFQDQAAQTAQAACKGCAAGKFQDQAAQTADSACKGCAVGKFQNQAAQTAESVCKDCAAGTFQDQVGQAACKDCVGDTYQPLVGQDECLACPAGRTTEYSSASSARHCSISIAHSDCEPGYYPATELLAKVIKTKPAHARRAFSCEKIELGTNRGLRARPPATSRWLHQDFNIDCDSDEHRSYEVMAGIAIGAFAFGVPALFWGMIYPHRKNLMSAGARHLRFFSADYKPRFWYWEVVECLRKLILAGIALFFGEQGSLFQVVFAMCLAVVYIHVLSKLQPYKRLSDSQVAVLANIALFFVLLSALLMKVLTAFEATGGVDLGFTEDTLGYFLIANASVILVVSLVSLRRDVREFNERQSFRHDATGDLLTMQQLDGDKLAYHVFVSHSQQDGGDQVQNLKKDLEKRVNTISVFTDVAAGRDERGLTKKSDLYGAIEKSGVFLVFLTKTYFTRKWCVLELQEALAKLAVDEDFHIVLVLDMDERHGGMTLAKLVEYVAEQEQRSEDDRKAHASNLWNRERADGSPLARWVADKIVAEPQQLRFRAFTYQATNKPPIQVPERILPVIPWFRFTEEKKVALTLMMEEVLAARRWDMKDEERVLKLPAPRPRLLRPPVFGRTTNGRSAHRHHVFISGRLDQGATVEAKLKSYDKGLEVYRQKHKGDAVSPAEVKKCVAVLVVCCSSVSGTPQLASDPEYQKDLREALDYGLHVILLLDVAISVEDIKSELHEPGTQWLKSSHIKKLLDPIAVRSQASYYDGSPGGGSRQDQLFAEATSMQIVSRIVEARESIVGRVGRMCCNRRNAYEVATAAPPEKGENDTGRSRDVNTASNPLRRSSDVAREAQGRHLSILSVKRGVAHKPGSTTDQQEDPASKQQYV
eukprot:g2202.t1